jgi:hypothetical protein
MAPLAKVANPSGPASRAPDGSIILPGGPLSTDKRDCSDENDHCTRGTRWCSGMPRTTDHVPCFKIDGKWYSWIDKTELQPTAAWLTTPATMDEIFKTTVIVFVPPDEAKEIVLPRSERESLGEPRWKTVMVDSIEEATQTFDAGRDTYNVSSARMLVVSPEPLRMSN